MSSYQVYTDGSASPNPGPGGAGIVFLEDGKVTGRAIFSGGYTTNNIMELTAIIEALRLIPPETTGIIHTDSNYAVKGVTEWSKGWIKRGWKNSKGKDVMNRDLWEELLEGMKTHPNISLKWVKAHCGIKWNEEADRLANIGTAKSRKVLQNS